MDADSTPPASTTPGSARSIETASTTAARPLPHCRSTVRPGTPTGSPACSAATRATSPPGPMQLPRTTSRRSAPGSSSSASARMTGAARSAAVSAASERPAVPMGVRRAAIRTGASSGLTTGTLGAPRPTARPRRGRRRPRGRPCRPAVTGNCGRWNHSRGRWTGDSRVPRRRPGPVGDGDVRDDGRDDVAEPAVRHTDDHDVRDAGSAQPEFDVGDQHGGPAGEHHVGTPPGDGQHPALQAAAVADGGEAVGVDGERSVGPVVAEGEVGRADPEDAVPDLDLRHPGTGGGPPRGCPRRRTTAPPPRSSG